MKEYLLYGDTLPQAYHKALTTLNYCGEITDCADWNTRQKELSMTMVVTDPLKEPMISKCFIGGPEELQQYVMEIIDGILDFEVGKGNWTYTYHQRMVQYPGDDGYLIDQVSFVVNELKRNPSSRRAVMMIRSRDDIGSDDPACFCKGTKILTPSGYKNIENLQDGDEVYTYDFSSNDYIASRIQNCFEKTDNCLRISTFFNSIDVSKDQLVYTKTGWKKASELTESDYVLYSDININTNYSLWHLIGCLIGDGWISTPTVRHRGIRRKDIGFSVHPNSNIINCKNLLCEFTKNKIVLRENVVNSNIVGGNHLSKKFEVSDYKLHDLLMNYIPYGRKISGEMLFSAKDMSKECIIDFLTGIFSAEGCITYHDNGSGNYYPAIELAMVWKECVEEIDLMLNILNIDHHSYFYDDSKGYKIRISSLFGLLNFIESGIDFRFDSRKQIKFLNLKYNCIKTDEAHEFYKGNIKWKVDKFETLDNALFVPIEKIEDIGENDVYDFTVSNEYHNVVANNIICHNCLQHIQYFIRNGKLDCDVLFRSNDAAKATFMNAFALIMLQKCIADELGVKVGTYTHRANSFHCYEKDWELLHGYARRIDNAEDEDDITYEYDGDWSEVMEDAIPEILKKVEVLKNNE